MASKPHRPRDPNHLAHQIMLEATGQVPKAEKVSDTRNPAAVALSKLGASKGAMAALPPFRLHVGRASTGMLSPPGGARSRKQPVAVADFFGGCALFAVLFAPLWLLPLIGGIVLAVVLAVRRRKRDRLGG